MIELCDVTKRYESPDGLAVEALRDVSLQVRTGEIFGIIGLSGAGKSTLLRLLNRLERPTSGRILVDGVDLGCLAPAELLLARRSIGMIFQHFNLLKSRTVWQNVAYPLEIAGWRQDAVNERVKEMLSLVGLDDKTGAWPAQLSGGQKQRVAIARALAPRPKVLLCDEATSALDPRTTRSILHLLEDVNRSMGLTVVLITHEMDVIREICHRVAILDAGFVVEEGPVREVFLHPRTDAARELLTELPRRGPDWDDLPRTAGCPVYILRFEGASASLPVVSRAIRHSGVDVNILAGEIDRLYASQVGNLTVQLSGKSGAIDEALSFFREQGLALEVVWNG